MNTDTPRTDALYRERLLVTGTPEDEYLGHAELKLARQLERELAALTADRDSWKQIAEEMERSGSTNYDVIKRIAGHLKMEAWDVGEVEAAVQTATTERDQLRLDLEAARNERNRAALEERQKWMPYAAQVAKLRAALEVVSECLEVTLGRLGVCGQGDGADHKADEDSWGGSAALTQARAALSDPAPPVVLESEAKALVEAGNKFIQVWRSGQYYLPELEAFREALATYDANHPKP